MNLMSFTAYCLYNLIKVQQEVLFPNSSILLFISLRTPHPPSATTPLFPFALQEHFSKEVSLSLGSASYPPYFLKLTLSPFGPLHSSQTFCQGVYIAKPNTFVLGPAMDCRVSLLLTHLRAPDEAFKSLRWYLGGAGLSIDHSDGRPVTHELSLTAPVKGRSQEYVGG